MKGMEAREKALIKPAELKQQCIDSGEKKISSSSISKFGVSSSGSSSSSTSTTSTTSSTVGLYCVLGGRRLKVENWESAAAAVVEAEEQ